jgi:translation initiation factor IF-3
MFEQFTEREAQERGFDLMPVAPEARPPIYKLLRGDYLRQERLRRARESKHPRDVALRLKMSAKELSGKVKLARSLLKEGWSVKVSVRSMQDSDRAMIETIVARLKGARKIKTALARRGAILWVTLAPVHPQAP